MDHTGCLVDVEVRHSGQNHDAHVFKQSALCVAMDNGSFVLGNPNITIDGARIPPLIIANPVCSLSESGY